MDTEKPSPRRVDFYRLVGVLIRPRQTFAEIGSESHASWFTPMLALTIMAALAVLVAGYLRTRAAMMGEIPLPPDWQYWTPDMQNQYMQAQQATQGPAFMYVIPLVGSLTALWLGWLILGGLLHLGSTLFGGRGSMQSALNIVAWGSLPYALRDVLRIIFMLSVGHVIASPGLSGFTNGAGMVQQLLTRTDIFLLWNIFLLVIGFAVADGLPRGKAFASVAAVMLLVLLAQSGIGALLSGFGGNAGQRPFF